MEFKKYSSIENHYREKYIDILRMNSLESVMWVITEKIHGANFSFWSDGETVKVASRNQFVDETFYSSTDVVNRYSGEVLDLAGTRFPGSTVVIYGELYGPGVQKGVNYGDTKDFVAFDVRVDGEFLDWLEVEDVIDLMPTMEMVPEIAVVESLTQALEYNNAFTSELGRRKGVTDADNIVEGTVLKPLHNTRIGEERVIIKSKNEKWSEKSKSKKPRQPKAASPLVPVIEPYVNVNRMNAVTSKMGEITPKQFGLVIKAMSEDVIADMVKDGDVGANWRDDDDTKELGKVVSSVVVPFLKRELLPTL